jgi:predicted dehydrogenase
VVRLALEQRGPAGAFGTRRQHADPGFLHHVEDRAVRRDGEGQLARAELAMDFPGVPAYDSLADLLAVGVDAVTITTPPQTRRELVLQAVAAGVPTIADKPFARTPTAAGSSSRRRRTRVSR